MMLETMHQIRKKLQSQQLTSLKALYIDSVDIKPARYGSHFNNSLNIDPSAITTEVICQHGADSKYVSFLNPSKQKH